MREKPAELDAPLSAVHFLQNLFRAGELLIPSHLVYRCAEVLTRQSCDTDGMKSLGLCFCAEQEPDGRVCADLAHGTPERKEFLSVEEHTGLIDKYLGKSGSAQGRRGTDPKFFQSLKSTARKAKVLIHRFTQI